MDSTNPSKRRLQEKCESSDRISNLPSSVLGLILSYLPTKDAVATSVLSTRWKSIFPTHVPLNELVFDDTYTFTPRPLPQPQTPSSSPSPSPPPSPSQSQPRPHTLSDVFFDFVDKLLNVTLRDVPSVKKIFIKWGVERSDYCNYSDDKIASWVCAAIRLKVQHLVVIASMLDSRVLFENLLNGYTTLVELEWGIRNLWFIIPNKFRLPNLKKLSLNAVILRHKSHLNELLDCCPVLVELRLISCEYLQYIRNRAIKKLFIVGGAYCETGVMIDAPSLEAFGYEGEGEILAKYAMRNTGSLHSVCVGFDCLGAKTTENLRLAELFIAWSRIKSFCLYGNAMKALYCSSVPLPEFINLTCLAIGCLGIGRCGWGMLDKFLDKAPNLTKLTFEEGLCSKHSLVPLKCFSIGLNIKKIEIWKFKCRSNEIKLIEYLFQIGSELQELILHCLPHENMSDLVKLSMLPKSSNACKVLLKDRKDWEKSRYSRDTWF